VFHDRPPDGRTRTARARVVPPLWKRPARDVSPRAGPLRHLPEPQNALQAQDGIAQSRESVEARLGVQVPAGRHDFQLDPEVICYVL